MATDIDRMSARTGRTLKEDGTVVNIGDMAASMVAGGRTIGQSAATVTPPYNPGHLFFVESDGTGTVSVVYSDGSSDTIPATSLPAGTIYPVLCSQVTAASATLVRAVKPVFV